MPPFNEPVPEQTFLAKNYDENAKKGDKDPRAAFRNQNELPGQIAAGIVGPMGSSSFSLPNVEKALTEMESGFSIGPVSIGASDRRTTRRVRRRHDQLLSRLTIDDIFQEVPVRPSNTPSPATGQNQHDVLQSFFQSLLVARAAGPRSPSAQNGQNGSTDAQTGSGPNGINSGAE